MTNRIASMRVLVLAHDDMNLLDLTGPVQTLFTASRRHSAEGAPLYEVIVASEPGGLVTTSSGVQIMTVGLSAIDGSSIDTLIAPGGCKGEDYSVSPDLVAWIRRYAPTFRRICSVCTGAFLLAAAGQLDGRRVATHWEWANRLKDRHPTLNIDPDRIFIHDGTVWGCVAISGSGKVWYGRFSQKPHQKYPLQGS